MIELRWKIVALVKGGPEDNGIYGSRRTLQFRTQTIQMGYGYTAAPDGRGIAQYERPMGMTWSEWKDVPEFAADKLDVSDDIRDTEEKS